MFEVGDVLEIKNVHVREDESIIKINKGLVIRSFTFENIPYYVFLFVPTEFDDDEDFMLKTEVCAWSKGLLEEISKKIDHVDLTSFVV